MSSLGVGVGGGFEAYLLDISLCSFFFVFFMSSNHSSRVIIMSIDNIDCMFRLDKKENVCVVVRKSAISIKFTPVGRGEGDTRDSHGGGIKNVSGSNKEQKKKKITR